MNDRIRAVALGNDPADLLLQNGRVVDVLTETIYEADVAIADGKTSYFAAHFFNRVADATEMALIQLV